MLDHDWFLQHTTWWLSPVLRWFQTHELWGEGHQSIFRQFFTREIPEYSVGIFWDFEFCGEEYLMMGWVGQGICQHLPQCGLLRLYILGSHFWFLILIFDFWYLIFDFWFLNFDFDFWHLASVWPPPPLYPGILFWSTFYPLNSNVCSSFHSRTHIF